MKLLEHEMAQYQPLIDSGCSNKLKFFLCGAYMPFCVPGTSQITGQGTSDSGSPQTQVQVQPDVPFVVPCRELCQEVHDSCSGEYLQRTGGLPWPGKLHCHRYPSYTSQYRDTEGGAGIPCTMHPYSLN